MLLEAMTPWNKKQSAVTLPLILSIVLAAVASLNIGCSSSAKPNAAPAPVEVSVAEVICKQLGDSDEFTGRLEPDRRAPLPSGSGSAKGRTLTSESAAFASQKRF